VATKTIPGSPLAVIAAGAISCWSGLQNQSYANVLRSLVSGVAPTPGPKQTYATTGDSTTTNPSGSSSAPAGSAEYDSSSALQKLWTSNGGASDTAAFAAAIAEAESGGSATVTRSNPDGGTNVGIFQLDTNGVGKGYTVAQLQNADTNTRITIMATANGTDWTDWGDSVAAAVGYHYTPGSAVP
jgi:hypothetical protein